LELEDGLVDPGADTGAEAGDCDTVGRSAFAGDAIGAFAVAAFSDAVSTGGSVTSSAGFCGGVGIGVDMGFDAAGATTAGAAAALGEDGVTDAGAGDGDVAGAAGTVRDAESGGRLGIGAGWMGAAADFGPSPGDAVTGFVDGAADTADAGVGRAAAGRAGAMAGAVLGAGTLEACGFGPVGDGAFAACGLAAGICATGFGAISGFGAGDAAVVEAGTVRDAASGAGFTAAGFAGAEVVVGGAAAIPAFPNASSSRASAR
jgi:hypothetical protein